MTEEEQKIEGAKPINLVINKPQAMLLSLAMSILPNDMSAADVLNLGGGEKGGVGMLLGMSIMMLGKVVNKEEREKMHEALKEGNDYVNSEVTVKSESDDFVSKAAFTELLNLVMETHGDMFKYYNDSEEQVALDDVRTFDILVNANKIVG
ncbi:MAG: hypothetical protein KAH32_07050 [Chlamydiia bacterium]|nr:hypothetical protein [Chlamydiia bacterium]